MDKILQLMKKHQALLIYIILGGLTTLVNFLVYFPLWKMLGVPASIATVIAWVVSVLFAFLTNKPFAFNSHDWSPKVVFPEFTKFVACRFGSGLAEYLFILLTVDILLWNGTAMKLLISVLVVIANYVTSKLLVFKNNKS
ncbi:MAG: GtrA family protein [Oscillospiraceae bacterium]|nr:GtrA family protein [Oscillospiraceae bacterium]